MQLLKQIVSFFALFFITTTLLHAQKTDEFYKDFLEKVENKKLEIGKAHLIDKDIYLSADIDTLNKEVSGQLGVVMHHTPDKTSMIVFRKKATWQAVYQEDSIPLYPYRTNNVVFKDFNQDQAIDIFVEGSDGGNREEQNNLYVAHLQSFTRVKGIEYLSYWESSLRANGELYYYTRYYCGCSGGCWTSQLFQIVGSQLIFKAEVGCNCEKIQYYEYQAGQPVVVATEKDCNEEGTKLANGLGVYWQTYLQNRK